MNTFDLEPNDVISSFEGCNDIVGELPNPTLKTEELIAVLPTIHTNSLEEWIKSGLKCKVLRPGQGWQSGAIKINLVFQPDEPPSDKEG